MVVESLTFREAYTDTLDGDIPQIKELGGNIGVVLEREEDLDYDLFDKTFEFSLDLSSAIRTALLNDLYPQANKEEMLLIEYNLFVKKELHIPRLTIANGKYAREILDNSNIEKEIDSSNFLLNLLLPESLEVSFWTGIKKWKKTNSQVIEGVWGVVNKYRNERILKIKRVNERGEHVSGIYYYLFEISNPRMSR